MTCNHSFQDINELDSDCVACWKERAEKAEAACAAWRECGRRLAVFAGAYVSHPKRNPTDSLYEVLDECAKLLQQPCGVGWLSPEKAKLLIEGIEVMWSFIKANEHDFSMSPNDERLIEQALAAVKEKP